MKKKKKYTMFDARTKEWDTTLHQGRTKRQVENNYKVLGLTIAVMLVSGLIAVIYTLLT